eukprot:m.221957 g.221957  ORF g.221957 m.221957 type:complete len:955 (+) comp13848_c0_seq3:25-2889(+)
MSSRRPFVLNQLHKRGKARRSSSKTAATTNTKLTTSKTTTTKAVSSKRTHSQSSSSSTTAPSTKRPKSKGGASVGVLKKRNNASSSSTTMLSASKSVPQKQRKRPLLGSEAVKDIQQRLKVKQPLAQIKKFQKEMTVEETADILPLIDLMGFTRKEFHKDLMMSMRQVLEEKIEHFTQQKLNMLLFETFPFVQFKELRQITTNILDRLNAIPPKVLRHLRDNPEMLEDCSMTVRRQVWTYDKRALTRDLAHLLDKYESVYADDLVSRCLMSGSHWLDKKGEQDRPQQSVTASVNENNNDDLPLSSFSSSSVASSATDTTDRPPSMPHTASTSSSATTATTNQQQHRYRRRSSQQQHHHQHQHLNRHYHQFEGNHFHHLHYHHQHAQPFEFHQSSATVSKNMTPMQDILQKMIHYIGTTQSHCLVAMKAVLQRFVSTGNLCFCQLYLSLLLVYFKRVPLRKKMMEPDSLLFKITSAMTHWIERGKASKEVTNEIFSNLTQYSADNDELGDVGACVRAPQFASLLSQSIFNQLTRAVNGYVLPRTHTRLIHLTHIVGSGYGIQQMLQSNSFRFPGLAAEIVQTTFPFIAKMMGEDVLFDDAIRNALLEQSSNKKRVVGDISSSPKNNAKSSDTVDVGNEADVEKNHEKPSSTHNDGIHSRPADEVATDLKDVGLKGHKKKSTSASERNGGEQDGRLDKEEGRRAIESKDTRTLPRSLKADIDDVYYINSVMCLYVRSRVLACDFNRVLQVTPSLMDGPTPLLVLFPTLSNMFRDILSPTVWPTFVRRHSEVIEELITPLVTHSSLFHLQVLDFVEHMTVSDISRDIARKCLSVCVTKGMLELGPLELGKACKFKLDNESIKRLIVRVCKSVEEAHHLPNMSALVIERLRGEQHNSELQGKAVKDKQPDDGKDDDTNMEQMMKSKSNGSGSGSGAVKVKLKVATTTQNDVQDGPSTK